MCRDKIKPESFIILNKKRFSQEFKLVSSVLTFVFCSRLWTLHHIAPDYWSMLGTVTQYTCQWKRTRWYFHTEYAQHVFETPSPTRNPSPSSSYPRGLGRCSHCVIGAIRPRGVMGIDVSGLHYVINTDGAVALHRRKTCQASWNIHPRLTSRGVEDTGCF